MQIIVLDAMVVSNYKLLDEIHALSEKIGWRLCTSPAVKQELDKGAITVPPIEVIPIEEKDKKEIEKIIKHSSMGKDAITKWKRGILIKNLGEIECIVIAKKLKAIFVSEQPSVRKIAGFEIGLNNVYSIDSLLNLLHEEISKKK
jgi:hypothetical protein